MDSLKGEVRRITFRNLENGYSVLKVAANAAGRDRSQLTTVVGILPGLESGDEVEFHGVWGSHPKFGKQFTAESFQLILPSSPDGLRTYLIAHIKGIGPVLAEKIIQTFKEETARILEHEPAKLAKISGITQTKAREIGEGWQKDRAIRHQLMKLSELNISPNLSFKIIGTYEDQAYQTIKKNPYQLAEDVWGVGFLKADQIASNLGFKNDHPERIAAGLQYTLNQALDSGHVFLPEPVLVSQAAELIGVSAEQITPVLVKMTGSQTLIKDYDNAIYLPRYHEAETKLAQSILALQQAGTRRQSPHQLDFAEIFEQIKKKHHLSLHPDQQRAITTALSNPISILTGGPGTGKSTALKALTIILKAEDKKAALCAPTGRAAKRITEITGAEAKTIHRTLKIDRQGYARYNETHPLPTDFLVIDEVSMLDILLAQKLLAAVGPKTHLLLVGDDSQLPSVQAGNVLADLIASQKIPVVKLTHIFRQAQTSAIVRNAHRINQGFFPEFPKQPTDFYLFNEPEAEAAANLIVDLVTNRIPKKFKVDPLTEIQVLAPLHKSACGVSVLNERLQEALNPHSSSLAEIPYGHRIYRVQDRVLQTSNNYDKEVFNGEVGQITAITRDGEGLKVQIAFDERLVVYANEELDQLTHAFAVSIHKSQGSEYPVVVLPILKSHYIMLARNLLYTAITRAKNLVVLVGSKQAIWIAINNDKAAQRNTLLANRLQVPS